MLDHLRETLDRAAPTAVDKPDFEKVWHRGRRRRRTRHLSAVVATVVVLVAAGWTTQQLATQGAIEVVDQPDDGRADLQLHADAIWKGPADDAEAAVQKFTAQAFGWSADAVEVELGSGSSGSRFVTASHRETELAIQILLTPGPGDTWQVVQVGNGGGFTSPAGSAPPPPPPAIRFGVPTRAETMQTYAFVNGRTVRRAGAATGTVQFDDLDVRDASSLGAVLVVYRDGTGEVVGARGKVAGTADQPSTPTGPTARQLLVEWQDAYGRPVVVPTRLPDGYDMIIAHHYVPTSPESSLPSVAVCVVPAGATEDDHCPRPDTDDPPPRTTFVVDGHTVVVEVNDGSRDPAVLDVFERLDWTTQWRQVDWIDTPFEQT